MSSVNCADHGARSVAAIENAKTGRRGRNKKKKKTYGNTLVNIGSKEPGRWGEVKKTHCLVSGGVIKKKRAFEELVVGTREGLKGSEYSPKTIMLWVKKRLSLGTYQGKGEKKKEAKGY